MPHFTQFARRSLPVALLTLATLPFAPAQPSAHAQDAPAALDCPVVASTYFPSDKGDIALAGERAAWMVGTGATRDIVIAPISDLSSPAYINQQPVVERVGGARITAPISYLHNPLLDGDALAFGGLLDDLYQVFVYDSAAGHSTRLSFDHLSADLADFQDGVIVWDEAVPFTDAQGDYTAKRVVWYDLAAGQREFITPDEGRFSESRPRVSGAVIAYVQSNLGGGDYLNIYNFRTGQGRFITADFKAFRLDGNQLVWTNRAGMLIRLDVSDPDAQPAPLSAAPLQTNNYGLAWAADAGRFAWAESLADQSSGDATLYTARLNGAAQPLLTQSAYLSALRIDGPLLAWRETLRDSTRTRRLRVYDWASGTLFTDPITNTRDMTLAVAQPYVAVNREILDDYYQLSVLQCADQAPNQKPRITSQPADRLIYLDNTSFAFHVEVMGTGPFRYQWYAGAAGDTRNPVGTGLPSLTVPVEALGTKAQGRYWVRVSGPFGSIDSRAATAYRLPSDGATSLLTNGGLEDAHPNNAARPMGWTVRRASGDALVCDAALADEGQCAFAFKGGKGENSQLSQVWKPTEIRLYPGDLLVFSGYFDVRAAKPNATISITITYKDGKRPTQRTSRLYRTQAGDYAAMRVTAKVARPDVARVVVSVNHKSARGLLYADELTLEVYSGAALGAKALRGN